MSILFQLPEKLQVANMLWDDASWSCEEVFSGYRCLLSMSPTTNNLSIFNWKMYGEKLQDISNYFPGFKDVKTDIYAEVDVVLVPPDNENKTYLNTLFSNGPLGAEKIQSIRGKPKLVLVDLLSYKNTDLKGMGWGTRRVYLEALFNDVKPLFEASGASVCLPKSVSEDKRKFFDWITRNGGKGVVLKDRHSSYVGGYGRNYLEVANLKWRSTNVSLTNDWVEEVKDKVNFDFDTYLALKSLDGIEL